MKALIAVMVALVWAVGCAASPVYLTADIGTTFFKWGPNDGPMGFPHFESGKVDFEPGLEWSPGFLAERGIWLRGSFRWQALGRSATFFHEGQTYVDGPRIGIHFRGRLVR